MNSITSRMPADEYHSLPGVSISRLKELQHSPQRYQWRMTHQKISKPMTLGTAAHCAVLEPERFSSDFTVWTNRTDAGAMSPRRGKVWDAFKESNDGTVIITEDEYDAAMAMQKAIRGDATAMKYLAAGDPEVTMQWEVSHQLRRGRADWLTNIDGQPYVVGLKTARDCRPMTFGSAAAKLGYGMQWAWYWDGYRRIKGELPIMVEIVVESEAPHSVVVYVIPEDVILQGEEEYTALLQVLERCEREDHWPGPGDDREVTLSMPSWYYGQSQDDLSELGIEV